MYPELPERVAQAVHQWWGVAARRCEPQGNAGGFSGARLWRIESAEGDWCLKAWPGSVHRGRLVMVHGLMLGARSAGLDFVPLIRSTRAQLTFCEAGGRVWDLCQWMPGHADFHDRPSAVRVSAATVALARLHQVWTRLGSAPGPCAALERRLHKLEEWDTLIRSGWRPEFAVAADDALRGVAERAWQILPRCLERTRELLMPLKSLHLRRHLCLGDLWHDHVFFQGDRVTGIIDYGAARLDTPTVDLARLLGSLVPADADLYEAGLRAYQSLIPLTRDEIELVHVLDYTGTVLGAVTWLLWVYRDRRAFDNPPVVARRLAELLARL